MFIVFSFYVKYHGYRLLHADTCTICANRSQKIRSVCAHQSVQRVTLAFLVTYHPGCVGVDKTSVPYLVIHSLYITSHLYYGRVLFNIFSHEFLLFLFLSFHISRRPVFIFFWFRFLKLFLYRIPASLSCQTINVEMQRTHMKCLQLRMNSIHLFFDATLHNVTIYSQHKGISSRIWNYRSV